MNYRELAYKSYQDKIDKRQRENKEKLHRAIKSVFPELTDTDIEYHYGDVLGMIQASIINIPEVLLYLTGEDLVVTHNGIIRTVTGWDIIGEMLHMKVKKGHDFP